MRRCPGAQVGLPEGLAVRAPRPRCVGAQQLASRDRSRICEAAARAARAHLFWVCTLNSSAPQPYFMHACPCTPAAPDRPSKSRRIHLLPTKNTLLWFSITAAMPAQVWNGSSLPTEQDKEQILPL